jgi:hypothetical protein
MEPRTGEDLSEFHLAESRTENLESLDEVSDEIGEPVHWLRLADECVRPLLIETAHPGSDGERAHQEDASGLGEGPAADGTKFENGQSGSRGVMGSPVRLNLLHSGVLDANLFAQELDFLAKPVLFSPSSKLRVHALRRPALGQCQGSSRKGDDLDDRRPDAAGPASG